MLDDFGKENMTEWKLGVIYDIINARYENLMPILVTTNYSDEELISRMAVNGDRKTSEAIISRLHESCYLVEMNGKDFRFSGMNMN